MKHLEKLKTVIMFGLGMAAIAVMFIMAGIYAIVHNNPAVFLYIIFPVFGVVIFSFFLTIMSDHF